MKSSSIYIPIEKDYGLLELEYNSTQISTSNSSFLRIKNALNGTINYCSYNPLDYKLATDLTGNTLDVTALETSETEWTHLDLDRPISYFERQNPNFLFQSVWHDVNTNLDIYYNTLRFHILSGYTFSDIAGLITRIGYLDKNNNIVFVANNAYLKEDSINFNSKPIQIADRIYDRYIEIKFPTLDSLKFIHENLSTNLTQYDTGYSSFPEITQSRITLMIYEIDNYEIDNKSGQMILNTVLPMGSTASGIFRRELELYDIFASITAIIQESAYGDYFEIFPSYEGQFIEDYLAERESVHNESYMIIHDIDVYEALYSAGGYTEVRTHSFSQIQEDNFDKPFKFRPIIESDFAVAFTIEYTVRLFDRNNPSHIIRRASYTSMTPKKYGKWLERLNIPTGFQPLKVVNKIISETKKPLLEINPTFLSTGLSTGSTNTNTSIIKSYTPIQFNEIVTNTETVYVDAISGKLIDSSVISNTSNVLNSNVIYGQGDCLIFLNEFDNFIKFKLNSIKNGVLTTMSDLAITAASTLYLVFENDHGDKIKIEPVSASNNNLNFEIKPGEFIFKIDSANIAVILKSTNNRFWITLESKSTENVYSTLAVNEKTNFEVVIYTGYWTSMDNYNSLSTNDYTIKNRLLQQKYDSITQAQNELRILENSLIQLKNTVNINSASEEQKKIYADVTAKLQEIIDSAKKL